MVLAPYTRGQDIEARDSGGEPGCDRRAMLVATLGDDARASRRIARDDRLDAELADDAAPLAERVDVALDGLDIGKPGAARRHQLVMDRHEPFADDEQPGLRPQMIEHRNPARARIRARG